MQKTKQHALISLLEHIKSELTDTQALITLVGPSIFYSAPYAQLHYLSSYAQKAVRKNPELTCTITISTIGSVAMPTNPSLKAPSLKTLSAAHCFPEKIQGIPVKELRRKLPSRPDYQLVNLKEILPKWQSK